MFEIERAGHYRESASEGAGETTRHVTAEQVVIR